MSLNDSPEELARKKVSREAGWKQSIREKIEVGLADCRAGRTVPDDQAWADLHIWRDEQMQRLGL